MVEKGNSPELGNNKRNRTLNPGKTGLRRERIGEVEERWGRGAGEESDVSRCSRTEGTVWRVASKIGKRRDVDREPGGGRPFARVGIESRRWRRVRAMGRLRWVDYSDSRIGRGSSGSSIPVFTGGNGALTQRAHGGFIVSSETICLPNTQWVHGEYFLKVPTCLPQLYPPGPW